MLRNKIDTVPVRKVEVRNRVVERTISVSGEVESHKSADLTFNSSSGEISNIFVSEGNSVQKGDLLASLSDSSAIFTLQSYKDARDVAIKNKEIYVENYDTNRDAVGGNDEYKLNVTRLDELISQAEASYNAHKSLYNNSFIYAPFDGIVIDVVKKAGDSAIAYEPIIKIADVGDIYFEVRLDQEDFGMLKEGQKAEIELDSYENRTFTGIVKNLPKFANGGVSPSFLIEISFDQGQEGILMGMTGDAKIVAETSEVEVKSLLYDEIYYDEEDNPYVWVIGDKALRRMYIETGLEGDIFTEVRSSIDQDIFTSVGDAKIEEGFRPAIQE